MAINLAKIYLVNFIVVIAIGLIGLSISKSAMASQEKNDEVLLAKIVAATVKIMRMNGYEMPDYRVIDGHTDVPLSGPREKYAFFAYLDKKWIDGKKIIKLRFYQADQIPLNGRTQLISYLIKIHEEQRGNFGLCLEITNAKYKKPEIIEPDFFLQLKVN